MVQETLDLELSDNLVSELILLEHCLGYYLKGANESSLDVFYNVDLSEFSLSQFLANHKICFCWLSTQFFGSYWTF